MLPPAPSSMMRLARESSTEPYVHLDVVLGTPGGWPARATTLRTIFEKVKTDEPGGLALAMIRLDSDNSTVEADLVLTDRRRIRFRPVVQSPKIPTW